MPPGRRAVAVSPRPLQLFAWLAAVLWLAACQTVPKPIAPTAAPEKVVADWPARRAQLQMRAQFTGLRYGDLKKQVAEMVVSKLEPIQRRHREITDDPAYLDSVLREGAAAVTPIADSTVELVKRRMGLYTA